MSTDTPTPERVTLTAEEAKDLRNAHERDSWAGEWNSLPTAIDHILAAREQALRDEIAGGCRHADVETFRSYPPHSKCLDCGQRVELRWATRGGAR